MQSVMNGQGCNRIPGAQEGLVLEGVRDRQVRIRAGSRADATEAVPPREIVVPAGDIEVVTPDLVADLYGPSLVISPGYVGSDRRRTDRSAQPERGASQWRRRAIQVVVLTAMVVIPLTMISARSIPPAATGPTSTQAQSSGKAGSVSSTGSQRGTTHVFRASSQQIARAEAAYRRALARDGDSAPAATSAASGGGAGAGTALTSARTAAGQVAAGAAKGQQEAAAAAAAQARAAAQAEAAQRRATDRAAAVQRRQARAATRAENQTARSAARTGADAPPAVSGTTAGA
jgi:hypothetical protein